jgi:hypothetical protein
MVKMTHFWDTKTTLIYASVVERHPYLTKFASKHFEQWDGPQIVDPGASYLQVSWLVFIKEIKVVDF